MTFVPSTEPDISEGIPTPLSRAQQASQVYARRGIRFDIAIGGIPFMLSATDNNPYVRETAPFQKQQVDTSREAGEQTLDGYWIRSQTSWHLGAGVRYYEPTSDPESANRFEDSLGIDVWTEGKFSLLHSTDPIATAPVGSTFVSGGRVNGVDCVFVNANGVVTRNPLTGSATTYGGTTGAFGPVIVAGAKVLLCRNSTIAQADASGNLFNDLWTGAPAQPTAYWTKSRLIVSTTNNLWELTLAGGAWPTTPLYTHPDSNWQWTALAEGPDAIFVAGRSNGMSSIYSLGLQDGTDVPKLGQAYERILLPQGEEVLSMHAALGAFLGIGTSRGFRVATILDNGRLALGPLIFRTDNPVRAVASADRFFYVGVENGHADGLSGVVRVDLSQQIGSGDTLRFAYASDARTGSAGRVSSVAMAGITDRVAIGVDSVGAFLQGSSYEDTGWLTSGRIRYGTTTKKAFRLLNVVESAGIGTTVVSTLANNDSELTLLTVKDGSESDNISLAQLSLSDSYRFKLTLGVDEGGGTPVIESMQVRAIPSPRRQRMIQMPLICADYQQSAEGIKFGREGYAAERLLALEYAEETMAVLMVQDFTTGETYPAQIESLSFRRPGPRSTDGRVNFGGYITLTVRKL